MKIDLDDADIERLAPRVAQEVVTLLKPYLKPTPQEDVLFDVKSLAEYLNVAPSWVYKHMGTLPRFKLDGLLGFRKKDIDALIGQKLLKVYLK